MSNKFTPERPPLIFVMPKNTFGRANKINPEIIVQTKTTSVFFLANSSICHFHQLLKGHYGHNSGLLSKTNLRFPIAKRV